jgi:hypothetical protein
MRGATCAIADLSSKAAVLNMSARALLLCAVNSWSICRLQHGVEAAVLGTAATEARKVSPAQEALHSRDAAGRRVEVGARGDGDLAVLHEAGHGQVGEEAARAGRAEGERRDAELLRDVDRERQYPVGDDARHGRETVVAARCTRAQGREQSAVGDACVLLHGLHELEELARRAGVIVGEAVRHGQEPEPRRTGLRPCSGEA